MKNKESLGNPRSYLKDIGENVKEGHTKLGSLDYCDYERNRKLEPDETEYAGQQTAEHKSGKKGEKDPQPDPFETEADEELMHSYPESTEKESD